MKNTPLKIAATVAAAAGAIGVAGVVAYDSGRSDGKEAGKRYEVYVDRSSLGVFGPEGAAALRRDDPGSDRFDFYVGKRKVLRLVGLLRRGSRPAHNHPEVGPNEAIARSSSERSLRS